jgi:enoyl-CoA hydratase
MADELVRLERRDDGVAVITLDHPKVNALSQALVAQLGEAVAALHGDPPGAVVVTGGPRVFAAGADITEFGGPEEARAIGPNLRRVLDGLGSLPRMVIAAVNGYALGGGCELAMACDRRIAGEKANFGQPEILLGIIPGAGGTQRLPRLVGPARAMEINTTGRMVSADEALRIGLADRIVPDDEVLDTALAEAAALAKGALVAQGLIKRAVYDGLERDLAGGLDLEFEAFVEVFGTEDSQIGVESFLQHGPGKAAFRGR